MAAKAAVGSAVNRILDLLEASPDGLSQESLNQSLGSTDQAGAAQALNMLLSRRQVQIFKQGNTIVYKRPPKDESGKFKGLTPDDMLVYQVIQQASNMGIWTKDMKRTTNLQQPQVAKAIKNLEARNLIKAVKSIANKNKKVYMLAELKPSKELTGGAWYTDQQFDSEFINVMKQQCVQFVMKQGLASVETIADAVRKSGITKEELRVKDYKQLMDMLVLDGEVEETVSTGVGPFSAFPPDTVLYRSAQSQLSETSAFTNIPCGVCPVLHECTEDGLISPKTCVYYQDWLKF
ncbi:hypothetical protein KP509_02G089100 [Ceratopteris richardii]|uniref:DNA-directed RNA polymerase III subunit RPC6 n=2 Tax=Ceratopteris richardii TaxID=49495 RepID=A0A8T2VFJ8_CERRI|nr:hypothetical protein KP509_02G089100 [Ceratopteris richardii]